MEHPGHSLPEFQAFHRWLDEAKNFGTDLQMNGLCLQREIGELSLEIVRYHWRQNNYGADDPRTEEARAALGLELADCLAYLLKIANYTGHDLQAVYTEKMRQNINRSWDK